MRQDQRKLTTKQIAAFQFSSEFLFMSDSECIVYEAIGIGTALAHIKA